MKHTIETMKTVGGSADSARKIAIEFCNEASSEVHARLERLTGICDLGAILDAAQLAIAADARAGVRHIHAGMQAVAEFHHRSGLSGLIGSTELAVAKMQEEAEAMYRWLHLLYSRD
ncbi:hypothetical protein [Paraburkholderia domus]|jgi:hypothetical protein|uniref:hypothetical protein n=1 Tax=Paraburkholderia domus TaxID=2793075 RepID=UPI001914C403|nr:hypothetical protein [Paraburkholderia domus]MBK5186103.1 hypothetical protein [Burkholderia sp. R-69749]MCI0150222.1 hypothetical protein [Paraburkholderia sediminicola]CAE6900483.1 hypothetical protein R69749_08121 [Paraburkholderia domus]